MKFKQLFIRAIFILSMLSVVFPVSGYAAGSIHVDHDEVLTEEEKAKEVAETALKEELGDEKKEITFKVKSIKNENAIWYIDYDWNYTKAVSSGSELEHVYNVEVDLVNKSVKCKMCKHGMEEQ